MKVCALLPLEEVAVGMRVAEAVVDAGGQVLVPAGAEISEGMLHGLQRREVAEIRIEREVEEDPAAHAARQAALAARLDLLFRKAGDGPETQQLYQAVLAYRMESNT